VVRLFGRVAARVRGDAGFGMVELLAAMSVLSVGVLALFVMFQSGMASIKRASDVTTAAALADTAMEQFRAVRYDTIGLAASDVNAADSAYKGDPAYRAISSPQNQLDSTVVVGKCPATPCTSSVPTATTTGADGRTYRIDTYVSWRRFTGATSGRDLKLVTVVVRAPGTSRVLARVASSFDESTGI
jgi:prepilin-type N-terminal cleavage/methylation domain-containing protein